MDSRRAQQTVLSDWIEVDVILTITIILRNQHFEYIQLSFIYNMSQGVTQLVTRPHINNLTGCRSAVIFFDVSPRNIHGQWHR